MHMTGNIGFRNFQFYLCFFPRVGYRGFKSRARPFSNLLPSGSLSVTKTTIESPKCMVATVLNLGASGHLHDYVIDNLLLCLGAYWEHSSSGRAYSVSAGSIVGLLQ